MYELDGLRTIPTPIGVKIRKLQAVDAPALAGLSKESAWVTKTWGGAAGLADSGKAWGAFVQGNLVSVACTFFLGIQYEDLGIVTEPAYRGHGLSTACTAALVQDVLRQGKRVSWNTSTSNAASMRVAKKVGLRFSRYDQLFVTGVEIPED